MGDVYDVKDVNEMYNMAAMQLNSTPVITCDHLFLLCL